MPIIPQDQIMKELLPETPSPMEQPSAPPKEPDASLSDQVSAPWEKGNSIISALNFGIKSHEITDPSFNPFKEVKDTPYEAEASKFIYANNSQEVDDVKNQIDKEQHLNDVISHSGWAGTVSNLASGVFDPAFAIPAAITAASFPETGGALGAVAASSLSFGVGAASEEAALHASQITRTKQESAYNIIGAAALGGILGGAGSLLTKAETKPMSDMISNIAKTGDPGKIVLPDLNDLPSTGGSVGAAKVQVQMGDSSIAGLSKTAVKATQVPYFNAPIVEGLTSDSPTLRNMTQKLFETDLILNKNKAAGENIPTDIPVQTKINLDAMNINNYHRDVQGIYTGYAKSIKEGDSVLTYDQFSEQVASAMIRGDKHPIPEVQAAAERGRKEIDGLNRPLQEKGILPEDLYYNKNNPLDVANKELKDLQTEQASKAESAQKYQEMGLKNPDGSLTDYQKKIDKLSDEVKFLKAKGIKTTKEKADLSYLTNIYDVPKILKDRTAFEKVIADHYESEGTERSEAEVSASDAVDNIIGTGDTQVALSDISRMSLDKGVRFTKEKQIQVPSTKLEPWLKRDGIQIVSTYMKQAQQMLRFQEFLESEGVSNLGDLRAKLKSEYTENLTKANILYNEGKGSITTKQFNTLKEQQAKSLSNNTNLLNDFSSIMLGQYSQRTKADRALSLLKTYNYMRLMGYFTITAIPHLGAAVVKQGLGNTIIDGLAGSLRMILSGAREANISDLRDMGIGLELETNNTLKSIVDPTFSEGYRDVFMKGVDKADHLYSKATGLAYYVNTTQRVFSNIAMSRIIRDLKGYSSLSDAEKTYLNSIHIGEEHVQPILDQFDKYGTTVSGGHISNAAQWKDREAAQRFMSAMQVEANSMVPRAGQGDIPRIIQRYPLARAAFQFKGFFAAVGSKVLLSGLQRRDAAAIQGFTSLIALGAASYVIRTQVQGKEPDLSVSNLLLEGFSRSGALGLLSDPIFGGAGKMFTNKGRSRYQQTNPSEFLLGPSASLFKDLSNIGTDVLQGHVDEKTGKSMMNLVPGQNIWWLRTIFDKMNQ